MEKPLRRRLSTKPPSCGRPPLASSFAGPFRWGTEWRLLVAHVFARRPLAGHIVRRHECPILGRWHWQGGSQLSTPGEVARTWSFRPAAERSLRPRASPLRTWDPFICGCRDWQAPKNADAPRGRCRRSGFCPDGQTFAEGVYDHTSRLWGLADGKTFHTLVGHKKLCLVCGVFAR